MNQDDTILLLLGSQEFNKSACDISMILGKTKSCGLYYKHVMIVNDDSSIVSK